MRTATVNQSGMDLGDPVPVAVAGRMPRQDSGCAGNLGKRSASKRSKEYSTEYSSRPLWNLSNRKGREEIAKNVSGASNGSQKFAGCRFISQRVTARPEPRDH